MMSNDERLVYMVNQIARNFATMGEGPAATATADHIASFWDPRMKARILAKYQSGDAELTAIAARAIAQLRDHGAPPAQTAATQFNAVGEAGHSDAG
ncbi:MAG: formate dehydrogenase subunit delta [Sphingobium sp.]|nr:formate dehydrogenase subunit delta [Sphingobium sp.]